MSGMPNLEYAIAPCPQCGATDVLDAETKCTATQQMSGDYECAGTDCKEDAQGRFMFPTQESLDRLDRWYDEDADRLEQKPPVTGD